MKKEEKYGLFHSWTNNHNSLTPKIWLYLFRLLSIFKVRRYAGYLIINDKTVIKHIDSSNHDYHYYACLEIFYLIDNGDDDDDNHNNSNDSDDVGDDHCDDDYCNNNNNNGYF